MSESIDLDAAQALVDAATPGPWSAISSGVANGDHWYICDEGESIAMISANDGVNEGQREPDAEFIAQARTLVPALIKAVRTQKLVANSYLEALQDAYRPHVKENEMLRKVTAIQGEEIERLEAVIARVKAADPDLFDPDEHAEDKVYESYGSNGRYLREDFLDAVRD